MVVGSGELRDRIGFFKRPHVVDGYGNTEGDFAGVPDFECFAKVRGKFSGEDVQAARLQGVSSFTITVRQTSSTRQVDTAWKARDMNTGAEYALIAGPVDPDGSRVMFEFLAQTGVAA